jgi:DNA-binding NarL/FixJ family response regulator
MRNFLILSEPAPPPIDVLLAEGLPLVRALLRDLLTAQPGVRIVAEVSISGDLLPHTQRFAPDLVVLDWALGGLDALQALRALDPAPAVIVLIAGTDPEYCAAVLAHGGAACLPREHLHRVLPSALRRVSAGDGKGTLYEPS